MNCTLQFVVFCDLTLLLEYWVLNLQLIIKLYLSFRFSLQFFDFRMNQNLKHLNIRSYWLTGLLAFWLTGLLAYWLTGLLAYWLTGLLAY